MCSHGGVWTRYTWPHGTHFPARGRNRDSTEGPSLAPTLPPFFSFVPIFYVPSSPLPNSQPSRRRLWTLSFVIIAPECVLWFCVRLRMQMALPTPAWFFPAHVCVEHPLRFPCEPLTRGSRHRCLTCFRLAPPRQRLDVPATSDLPIYLDTALLTQALPGTRPGESLSCCCVCVWLPYVCDAYVGKRWVASVQCDWVSRRFSRQVLPFAVSPAEGR